MAQDRTHVHCDAKRNRIEMVMRASAVADREVIRRGRRETQTGAKSVVRRQARTACCLVALQKRRAVTGGRSRSVPKNPAVYRLRPPWRDIEGRRRYAKPINNMIRGSGLEVAEFSVGSKRPPIDERIGYRVREAHLEERSPRAEVTIDSIRPVVGSVPGGDSVGRAAGGCSSGQQRLEIQRRIGKREPNLPVDIAQLRKRVRRRSSGTGSGISTNKMNGKACANQKVAPERVAYRRVKQHHLAFRIRTSVKLLDPRETVLSAHRRNRRWRGITGRCTAVCLRAHLRH